MYNQGKSTYSLHFVRDVQAINETNSSSWTLCVVESSHVVHHAMKTQLQELVCFIGMAA
ncbi:hypothetical protein CDEST_04477 [Colletotrichum destructivum]|uniref:Uncharacterized protein n=1 Tax=Colletotrichum destructivum TaxID=34406 RepID=A0AAX4I909_9PEZI|nr:hypothetical protein CDEST_04477 [Colletotrichum destructivum]